MKYAAQYSQLVMPDHINNVGTLFGGQMVSWMDIAAAKVAYRFLRETDAVGAVTRAIEKVEFKEPVFAGEWINFSSKVIKVGKSSVSIHVDAFAESKSRKKRLACTAIITMVAVKKKSDDNFVKFHHGNSVD